MPFSPMEGPVTIPMEGISLQCMYDRLDYVIALSIAQVRGKEYTPLGASSTTNMGNTFWGLMPGNLFQVF